MKSYDLTDLETAKSFARVKRADSEADVRLPKLISGASLAIIRYTRREFVGLNDANAEDGVVDVEAFETREFEYDGSGYLSLAPYEAREIESVTLDGRYLEEIVVGATQIGSASFVPSPRQKSTEGTFFSLRLPKVRIRDHRGSSFEAVSLVEVAAKWGIVGVPEDVELACLHAVAAEYRNPEGMPQRTIGDGLQITEDVGDGSALPRKSRQLLSPFIRP